MALTGDFHRLAMLRQAVRTVARGRATDEMRSGMRDEAHRQVIACFAERRDPYGHSWPPPKRERKPHPLLDKSGDLLASIRAVRTATGLRVTMLGYARYHWQPDRPGALPQRAMLPTERQGLGPIWTQAFLRVVEGVRRRLMRTS